MLTYLIGSFLYRNNYILLYYVCNTQRNNKLCKSNFLYSYLNFYVTYCPEDVEAPSTLIRIQTTVLDVVIDNPYISYIKMMDILDLL